MKTKDLLKQAYSSIPTGFAFREVKFYLYQAMQKLEHLEKKEAKKQQQTLKEKNIIPTYQNPYAVKETIDIIDKMIADEQKKIPDNKGKNTKDEPQDDDSQTFHG